MEDNVHWIYSLPTCDVLSSSWRWHHRSPGHPDRSSDGSHVVIVYDMLLNSAMEDVFADVKLTSNFVARIFMKRKSVNAINRWLSQHLQSISRDNSLPSICVTSALSGQEALVSTNIEQRARESQGAGVSDHQDRSSPSPSPSFLVWQWPFCLSFSKGGFCLYVTHSVWSPCAPVVRLNPLRIILIAPVRMLIPGKVGEHNYSPNKIYFSEMHSCLLTFSYVQDGEKERSGCWEGL